MTQLNHNNLDCPVPPVYSPLQSVSPMKLGTRNTVVVFDWDDTLFPTTKLKEILNRPNTENHEHQSLTEAQLLRIRMTEKEMTDFVNLSWVTYNVLTSYIDRCSKQNIFILSASQSGWIQKSLSIVYGIGYYSYIYHLLFERNKQDINDNICIYNPSDSVTKSFKAAKYHKQMSSHPVLLWKYEVLRQIFNSKVQISKDVINTMMVIGDSIFEYKAAEKLNKYVELAYGENNENINIDRIKLMSKPTINGLTKQLTQLYQLGYNKHVAHVKKSIHSNNNISI